MEYFVIQFIAFADGVSNTGLIGAINIYNPNAIKNEVTRQMKTRYPESRNIAVVIHKKEQVTEQEYNERSKEFIELL